MDYAIVIIASLVSGLIGILISNRHYARSQKVALKQDTFRRLMGNRFDIQGDEFTRALNEVFVVFQDSEPVLRAFTEFHDTIVAKHVELANDRLVKLLKAICLDLDIDPEKFSESIYLKPFNLIESVQFKGPRSQAE